MGSSAIVFGEDSTSLRMPSEDEDVPGSELFAFGLFMLILEKDEALVELVRAKVEEIAAE